MTLDERGRRESDFWGHHIPDLETCLAEVAHGPDPNTAAMLRAVEPAAAARILDFACGGGVTSAWLARKGAEVVGVDLSPESLDRAREVHGALNLRATFVGTLDEAAAGGPFDAVVGRYALHHTDVPHLAPQLAALVRPGGRGAFVETFATNPLLRVSRSLLPGRFGIPRLGTLDEQPLGRADLAALESAFGDIRMTCGQMAFLRIFDRQVLHYRSPRLSTALGWLDDRLARVPGSTPLSYFQVAVVTKRASRS